MKRKNLLIALLILAVLTACNSVETSIEPVVEENAVQNSDAAEEIKSSNEDNSDEPNYEIVFPDDQVNTITITISPDNYALMLEDMTELYGEFGTGGKNGGPQQPGENKPEMAAPKDGQAPNQPPQVGDPNAQNRMDKQGGFGMGVMDRSENPIWVEATIEFEGDILEHVGIRFKGNSSLNSSWNSGSYKIPFKLDFDQFENDYEDTLDQRFYGFKQLSFGSNFSDSSYLREMVAADIFREAGVPSADTAFYAVYFDTGSGPQYMGLYTAVEVIDDTVIETQFEDDGGNVYKPSGAAATFAEGSFNEVQFDKETNIEEADYSDVLALYDALHAATRLTDPEQWREDLEAVFDVDNFLLWLATNTLIQNWDTYGSMSHNYYLYTDPDSEKLVWIPWDNNMALSSKLGKGNPISIHLQDVGDNWPLISFLVADETYYVKYNAYLEQIISTVFYPERMESIYNDLHELVAPYVEMEESDYTTLSNINAFFNSVEELLSHTHERYETAITHLASLD